PRRYPVEALRKPDCYYAGGAETSAHALSGHKTNAARASHPSRIVRRPLKLPSRRLGQRDDGTGPAALA
ncbi:MAG: hypothetical protein ACLP56_02910, partial [Candidatus Sulfotelmatobacter sp.]